MMKLFEFALARNFPWLALYISLLFVELFLMAFSVDFWPIFQCTVKYRRMINAHQSFFRNARFPLRSRYGIWSRVRKSLAKGNKPLASEVLTRYLVDNKEPPWTSYFVKYSDVVNDQRGMSHFNWEAGASNYHVLRTGCFPYIKYHCTKRPKEDLTLDDKFYKAIKIINLGIPTLMYGLAATQLIKHEETVTTSKGKVTIYFLLPEDKGSRY